MDYRNLDEVPEFAGQNTTTEFMAHFVFSQLAESCRAGGLGDGGKAVTSIKVLLRESPLAWATYEGDLGLMRIALLVPAPFATVSGGYNYDRAIVDGLRAQGHAVEVLELDGMHPLPDAIATASARAAWQRVAPDTVPVIDGLCLPAFAPLADALAARHAVGLIHHPTALETGHDAATREALRASERHLMPLLSRVSVTSAPTGQRRPEEFGVAGERISVVVPGTAPAPRSAGAGGPCCAILAIGVVTPRKGHDVLLRALARLSDLDWTLTIAGAPRDPVHARSLEALAEQLGIARRVTFPGEVIAEDLERLWQRADLFALATHYEGYGMAIAEAIKRALPVASNQRRCGRRSRYARLRRRRGTRRRCRAALALRRLIFDNGLRARWRISGAWRVGCGLPTTGRRQLG